MREMKETEGGGTSLGPVSADRESGCGQSI